MGNFPCRRMWTVSNQDKETDLLIKSDRRGELILTAFRLIAEKGFEGLRVRDVAQQVGINGATLHYYFPTKEDLIQAVVEYTIVQLQNTMKDLDSSRPPAEKIHTHLTRLLQLMHERPEIFVVLTEISLRAQRQPVMNYLLQQNELWQGMLAGILREGIEQKIWPGDLNPDDSALAIVTILEGASLWAVSDPSRGERALNQLERWLGIK